MGIFDNIIQRVAGEIAKAAPTVTPVTEAMIQQAVSQYGQSVGLTRNPNWASQPFAPGQPIVPGAINAVREDGRPDPRRYEFQVAQNINITPTRLVPFSTLRSAADQIDILRRCIEVMKNKMTGLDWDIVLSDDAVQKVMAETGEKSYHKAMAYAKTQYQTEIARLKTFWEVPDISNGLIFTDWLSMFLEDNLVLDAVAVWPQKTVGGELLALQILDGSTIKPLIDDRGMRPQYPYPAFQQILYGFPRSEFNAPDEEIQADGEFTSDELAYMVRNRRTNTVYGSSPVERALPVADIYLRHQQWLRAEYTEGTMPEMFMKTGDDYTPDQLRAYENVLNDLLAGQTPSRKRITMLPGGFEPWQSQGYDEKFKSDMDLFLIEQICGHFGVLPTEIGMAPKGGLGGSGHQAGQAQSSEVIGLVPLSQWVGKMLSQLSYIFLGMPRELEFKFQPSERTDALATAQADDIVFKRGGLSINEARAKEGMPLLDSPEADYPIVVTPSGTFFITADGLLPFGTGSEADGSAQDEEAIVEDKPEETATETAVEEPTVEEEAPAEVDATDDAAKFANQNREIRNFKKWLKRYAAKSEGETPKPATRNYEFAHLPTSYADTLNKFAAVGDHEAIHWFIDEVI